MDLNKYVKNEVAKLHKKVMLESELNKINKQLSLLKEGEEQDEVKTYESNVYESYKKDLEEVVNCLSEACNKLESAVLKQEKHSTTLPEVAERMEEAKKHREILFEILKEIKGAKIKTERKLYEI